jgi:hypothetical protein
MEFEIEKFSGVWESEDRYRLEMTISNETSALVSLYHPNGLPIKRPYFHDTPTIDMPATYDDYDGDFLVDLWETGKGFRLSLDYEERYLLDQWERDALAPSLLRYEKDHFLDQYYTLFGKLKHFTKIIV